MKDWQPSAFSPRTGLLYVPHNNLCMDYEGGQAGYIAGTPYVGAQVKMYAGPGGHRGVFSAWDPAAQRQVWAIKERFPVWSGAVVTAGDVAFYGTMDRWFKAVDARSGKPLWQFRVGLRHHRPADHLSRGPTAASTSPSSPVSAAGPAPRRSASCPAWIPSSRSASPTR